MNLRKLLIQASLVSVLASCGEPQPVKGVVVDKNHEAERGCLYDQGGLFGFESKERMSMPVLKLDDEDFILKVRFFYPNAKKYREKKLLVDRETYERLNVGDPFDYSIHYGRDYYYAGLIRKEFDRRTPTKEEFEKYLLCSEVENN